MTSGNSSPDRRFLVAVDMERYGTRSNQQQFVLQEAFTRLMDEAIHAVGLSPKDWIVQHGGDGELAILPPGTPETVVVGRFVPELARILRDYNAGRTRESAMRLRVSLHQGLVHLDGASGFPGEAVVLVNRLLDAKPLKRALTAYPSTALALIVSQQIFNDIVRQGYDGLDPRRFRQVRVDMPDKAFAADAWIHVPGEDGDLLGDLSDPSPPRGSDPAPVPDGKRTPGRAAPSQEFHNVTTYGPTVFGDNGLAIGELR